MEGSAFSRSHCPLLFRTYIAGPIVIFTHPPPSSPNRLLLLPFPHVTSLLSAQVYNDISHGGVFEDGCVQRNHVFPSIHDAVLFAQANMRGAPARSFQGVRSPHLKNPRLQRSQTEGPMHIGKKLTLLNLSYPICRMGTINHCPSLFCTSGGYPGLEISG